MNACAFLLVRSDREWAAYRSHRVLVLAYLLLMRINWRAHPDLRVHHLLLSLRNLISECVHCTKHNTNQLTEDIYL